MNRIDNDLLSVQEARILAENAREAQKLLKAFPQEKLDRIVDGMLSAVRPCLRELAVKSSEETEYGNWQDKYIKNRFICEALSRKLRGMRCVGILREDRAEKTMDIGVPVGVIAALLPATNPVSTAIYKAVTAVKSGNAAVFSPHPRAKDVTGEVLEILIHAAGEHGLPEGALGYLRTLSPYGAAELMNHKDTSLILLTGVPKMLKLARRSGKPVIYGGSGSGPAFIERTADIKRAVADIILSRAFDNGIMSPSEQSVVADGCAADEIRREFRAGGGYFMSEAQSRQLGEILFRPGGGTAPEFVGKPAEYLARRAGFPVPAGTKVLIAEQKYISEHHPYAGEKLCPVLSFYVEADWMHACEKCIELLVKGGNGHTLAIHSGNEDVIREFALKKPVFRMLVNTPSALGGIGATTNLFPAMTLGSGAPGGGVTADNVSPMNLIHIRKVGYGVRGADEILKPGGTSGDGDLAALMKELIAKIASGSQ